MKKTLVFLCAVTLVLGIAGVTQATLITFDNKTVFINATGAASDGVLTDMGLTSGSYTINDVTLSLAPGSPQLYVGTVGVGGVTNNDWTLLLTGPDIAISGLENMDAMVSFPVFAFGFDFVEPTVVNVKALFEDSTFTVTLKDDSTTIGDFDFNAPNDVAAFVGAWTDVAFNTVEIRETTGRSGNEFFGEFYLGTNPVPEPGTMLLLGSGLIGLAGLGRKKFFRK